jgi:hypothetical protein
MTRESTARTYSELATHYAVIVDPARAFKPKVKRAMPYVRDSIWRGREFTSVQQMQSVALTWCRQIAGARAHRAGDGHVRDHQSFRAGVVDLPPVRQAPIALVAPRARRGSGQRPAVDVHVIPQGLWSRNFPRGALRCQV